MAKQTFVPGENKKELVLPEASIAETAKNLAFAYTAPSLHASLVQLEFNPKSGLNLMACIEEMKDQSKKLQKGDTNRIEDMLLTQAHSLQNIFTHSALKFAKAEYLNQAKVHGSMAMKAQNQCRQTLATLAEIKHPKRTTFIRNQATNQQINMNPPNQIPNENSSTFSNELLSESSNATMDTSRTPAASGANSEMATVENGGS